MVERVLFDNATHMTVDSELQGHMRALTEGVSRGPQRCSMRVDFGVADSDAIQAPEPYFPLAHLSASAGDRSRSSSFFIITWPRKSFLLLRVFPAEYEASKGACHWLGLKGFYMFVYVLRSRMPGENTICLEALRGRSRKREWKP